MLVNSETSLAPQQHTNGSKPGDPAPVAQSDFRDQRQERMAQNFSHIIAVMMRDRQFRSMPLSDLEWLVLPPVMAGQYKIGQAPKKQSAPDQTERGIVIPAAAALWARVSPNLDKKLSENPDPQFRLRFDEWASGDAIWLMAVAGDERIVQNLLQQLQATEFKGQPVKMRSRGPDGSLMIKTLADAA